MNITLTNKDADYIANMARQELKAYEKSYDETLAKMENILLQAKKLADKNPSKINILGYKSCEQEYFKVKEEMTKDLKERTVKWIRVVELMITGSDK